MPAPQYVPIVPQLGKPVCRTFTNVSDSTAASSDGEGPGSEVPQKQAGLDSLYPAKLMIRNTFLDFAVDRPSSLDGFFQERQIKSAPGSKVEGGYSGSFTSAAAAPAVIAYQTHNTIVQCNEPAPATSTPVVLSLADTLGQPQLGSAELPTVGSAGHGRGQCKPCAFFHRAEGCSNGVDCPFCHLCDADEKKRRTKEKRGMLRMQKAFTRLVGGA